MPGWVEDQAGKENALKTKRQPRRPSEQEIAAHEAGGHYPYRDWCRACVGGAGRSDAHKRYSNELGQEIPNEERLNESETQATEIMKVEFKNVLGQAEKRHGDDKMLVVRKSAGFLTNCREMHHELSTVCNKSHFHGSLLGQSCAGRAVVDSPKLVAAFLRGLRSGLEQSVNAIDVAEAGPAANRVSHHREQEAVQIQDMAKQQVVAREGFAPTCVLMAPASRSGKFSRC